MGAWQKDLQRRRKEADVQGRPRRGERGSCWLPNSWFLTLPRPQVLPWVSGHLHFLIQTPVLLKWISFMCNLRTPVQGMHAIIAAVQMAMQLSPVAGGALVSHSLTNLGLRYLPLFFLVLWAYNVVLRQLNLQLFYSPVRPSFS